MTREDIIVVGGSVVSAYYQGEVMAKIAKKILSGIPLSKLPIQRTESTKPIYNYIGLEKYNLDLNKLPEDSTIINQPIENVQFTKVQKKYLENTKKINLCIDPNWMPFEAFDKNGNHIGLSSDYIQIFKKESGLNIDVIKTTSWHQSVNYIKERKCDILPLAMETKERKEYLNFTTPYLITPLVLATKLNVTFIDRWDLLKNKKIGIVKGYALINIIKTKYPNLLISEVKDTKDGLSLVANGTLFGYIGGITDISYISQKNFMGELKIAGKFDEEWKLGVAVRNDDLILLSILESVIKNISEDTKQNILNKYIAIKYEKGVDYTLIWEILFIFFLICIAIWYRHLILKKSNIKLIKIVKKKTEDLIKLNKNLEQKVEQRTKSIVLQTKKTTDLLNNAAQGFLSFDKDFLIDAEYSLECEYLLSPNLVGKDITKFLLVNKQDKMSFFKETMIDALKEKNNLTSSLLLSLLPSELIINKRAILIDYKIISNNKFMIILTNITDKKKLQTKIKKEQQIHKMIVSIVSDSLQFYETKDNYETFCKDSILYINSTASVKDNSNTIITLIHTYKGLFAQLYMQNTVNKLHSFESNFLKFVTNNLSYNHLVDFIESFNLLHCMSEDLKIITDTLGEKFLTEYNQIKIDEKVITRFENKIISFCSLENERKKECQEILNEIQKIKNRSLKHQLSMYPKLCQQLCLSLNKSIYAFEIKGDDTLFVSHKYKPFLNSLIHVFRNCCDHGIETKEIRLSKNKSETGIITCNFKKTNDLLFIEISDDGKGVDLEILKSKLIDNKLLTHENIKELSENKIISYIFDNNFSTNEYVTQISGRGIGLSSVKMELDKLNGTVETKTNKDKGITFIFRLPANL